MAKISQCSGNCMACNLFQRQYCASQISYSNMRELEKMRELLDGMQSQFEKLNEKIDAIQNNEATLINPME